MPAVYVARRVLPRVQAELDGSFEVELHDSDWPPERETLLAGCAGKDGIVVLPTDRVDGELPQITRIGERNEVDPADRDRGSRRSTDREIVDLAGLSPHQFTSDRP